MSYQIRDNKIYTFPSNQQIGEVRNNKIYKHPSNQQLGEVRNNKIYKHPSNQQLGDLSKIVREIKDSSKISESYLVGLYHFLIKPIF